MDQTEIKKSLWWGHFTIPEDRAGYWRIGPLDLWVYRSRQEWRLASENGSDPLDEGLRVEVPLAKDLPEDQPNAHRFGFRKTKGTLQLVPTLADRAIVINPATPFSLLPNEELTIYVSTALWVKIQAGEPPHDLLEIPTYRPSDTWFGPSTREGELCYAGRTSARQQLENLPIRHHRAVSSVRVRNLANSNLSVERLKLPMPHMSLFASEDGQLWTETVTLQREHDGELAALQLSKKPPAMITKPRLICGPREQPTKGLLIRAFGGLIGRE
jgi:hypothetical protein